MNRVAADSHWVLTPRQGQYLAFIHAYTLVTDAPKALQRRVNFSDRL
jgi:hypothetical protein